jgi:SAM-dependent methyltransferase
MDRLVRPRRVRRQACYDRKPMRLSVPAVILLLASVAVPLVGQNSAPLHAPDVPYEPSTPGIVSAMLKLADVKKGDVVYDLGCGDGRIVIAAVKERGAVRGVGIDIDPQRIAEARENARKAGVGQRVEFRNQDLFEADIAPATVVMLYLWPEVNLRLRPKLLKELKPGTRIVSHSHNMGDWRPEKQAEADGHTIYFWTVPSR